MMKKILLYFIIFTGFSNLDAQTWRQYNLATGEIINIPFSYTSTAGYGVKSGSRGILPDNYSYDTSRNFLPYDIVNDPNAYPWRTMVKFNDVTGFLIDPYHVITAGHAIEFHPYFQNILFMAGYENGNQPYSYAKAEYFYLLTDYSAGSPRDYGIIKLDRPVGALAGWNGFGYNNTNSYFANKSMFNPSYPSVAPFDGKYLFNWKGILNIVNTEYFTSLRTGYGGMSGSPLYVNENNDNIAYGIMTNMGIKYNRITANKFDAINKIIDYNTPAQFDLVPLFTNVSPKKIKNGSAPESISFVLLNYSSENKSSANISVSIYLSQDQVITSSDELLATYNYTKSFNSKASELITQTASLPAINKPAGDYYVGIIVSGDNYENNNTIKIQDAAKITVTENNQVTIKGRIVSSQSNSGINSVTLNGFPSETKTDYFGNYEAQVTYGWSGTVTPSKEGFDFSSSSVSYSNIAENTTTNYTAAKKTFTISGYAKTPYSQIPLKNTKMSGLLGEPFTDVNGFYSVNVFYGWAGAYIPVRGSLSFSPYSKIVSKTTSSAAVNFSGGYYISGRCFDNLGTLLENVYLSGLPGNIYTNEYGEYSDFVDSSWSGTVFPVKDNMVFIPSQRVYTHITGTYDSEDYLLKQDIVLNLKVLLSGAIHNDADTMKTTLNYGNYLPLTPPDTVSGNGTPFVYVKNENEYVTRAFLESHPDIVDWIIIELRDTKDFNISIDTVAAFVRNDGQVLSISGDSFVPLNPDLTPNNYYIVVRHRNHISVMSYYPVFLNSASELYDFTISSEMYYGDDASVLLPCGKYAIMSGDADCNGYINVSDYKIFQGFSSVAKTGYLYSDFNLDGLLTGSDFNTFAPHNKRKAKTNVPNSVLGRILGKK